MLTELQAWMTIGDAYGTLEGERTEVERYIAMDGICCGLICVPLMSDSLEKAMCSKIEQDMPELPWVNDYFCALIPANDPLRADYCYLQAEIIRQGGVG